MEEKKMSKKLKDAVKLMEEVAKDCDVSKSATEAFLKIAIEAAKCAKATLK